jgi:DNA-binding NarL/FixJ family response regulator
MEAMSTVPLIREIKNENPNLKIIVMGLDNSDESVLGFIEAGVNGYILKEASFDELVHMINNIHQGLTSCPPHIVAAVFARITELSQRRGGRVRRSGSSITPREKKILELIDIGLSNKEIAQHLRISLYTVKNHVHNILDKLQVRYRREALLCAYESGLLQQPRPYRHSVHKD